ncbi:MAG: hypothetical protein WBA05_07665 [Gordonia sp. (in: high G+C Gram-positive bacteria)]|uniref:hypothetical protein n=1 Tax=Gordonia sp. (in: high G+C Gram-positive bacteria) TaxID=84139 RepID=UPI003C773B32
MSLKNALRNTLIALLAVVTALPFLVSPAHAAPNDGAVKVTAEVYNNPQTFNSPKTYNGEVRVNVLNGSVDIKDGYLRFLDKKGKVLEQYPLSFIAPDNRTYPIDATVKGNTATLVPSTKVARSTKTDAALLARTNVADRDGYTSKKARDDAALARLNQELAAGGTISALIGTAVGAVLGGLLATAVCGAVLLPALIACIPAGAAVGGIIGTVVIGGPAALVSIQRYFDTINKPFKNVSKR